MEPLKPWQCNTVQIDRIWIDYVYSENKAVRKWEDNWGYLKSDYNKMTEDIRKLRNKPPTNRNKKQFKLPLITDPNQKVSTVPFIPVKTSQEIGWRNGQNLERFGRFGRPKGSIIKHFNWPMDALP